MGSDINIVLSINHLESIPGSHPEPRQAILGVFITTVKNKVWWRDLCYGSSIQGCVKCRLVE